MKRIVQQNVLYNNKQNQIAIPKNYQIKILIIQK